MSSNDVAMEDALLEIAKELLQASDDLAATDPSASAKLAHEAYEIGRDLGIVRNHVDGDDTVGLENVLRSSERGDQKALFEPTAHDQGHDAVQDVSTRAGHADEDAELARILDRQKALLPKPVDLAPVRKPSRGSRTMTFESAPTRRSGWFSWMRSREWRHAG